MLRARFGSRSSSSSVQVLFPVVVGDVENDSISNNSRSRTLFLFLQRRKITQSAAAPFSLYSTMIQRRCSAFPSRGLPFPPTFPSGHFPIYHLRRIFLQFCVEVEIYGFVYREDVPEIPRFNSVGFDFLDWIFIVEGVSSSDFADEELADQFVVGGAESDFGIQTVTVHCRRKKLRDRGIDRRRNERAEEESVKSGLVFFWGD
ncbi:hypothetical protein LINGRAHAP2_LOCUS8872 [Linum grandiflorum]